MSTCANCGRAFGKLETPDVWSGHVVCRDCLPRLSTGARPTPTPPDVQTIQLTSKKLKSYVAGGYVGSAVGLLLVVLSYTLPLADARAAARGDFGNLFPGGMVLTVVSLAALLGAKAAIWWHHR